MNRFLFISACHISFILLYPNNSHSFFSQRPFTVADSYERTRLHNAHIDISDPMSEEIPFLLTPDKKKILMITSTGDAIRKLRTYSLRMYDVAQITQFLDGKSSPPQPTDIISIEHSMPNPNVASIEAVGIKNITVRKDNRTILFLAADKAGYHQLFSADLENGAIQQLTSGHQYVYDYRLDEARSEVIFTVGTLKTSNHCKQPYFSANEMHYQETICINESYPIKDQFSVFPPPNYFDVYRLKIEQNARPQRIAAELPLRTPLKDAVFSSNGKAALFKLAEPDAPAHLRKMYMKSDQYHDFVKNTIGHYTPTISPLSWGYNYYTWIDLINGKTKRFIDTPVLPFGNAPPLHIGPDTVALKDPVLLRGQPSSVRANDTKRSTASNGLKIDLTTGNSTVGTVPAQPDIEQSKDNPQFIHVKYGNSVSHDISARCRRSYSGEDHSQDGRPACYIESQSLALRIWLDERFDRPGKVIATNLRTGVSKQIFDPNPQFKNLSLGKVELLKWKDEAGVAWQAGLILPPDWSPKVRYPLVIQTHGFDPNSFLVDGPHYATGPYAAQALANRGMVVLQVPNIDEAFGERGQPVDARGIDAAIDLLNRRGLIDTQKIGLIGYSARGQLVFNMAVFPRYRPRAVLVADAVGPGPFGYPMLYKIQGRGMLNHELATCDSMPWGETQAEWIKRSAYYHLDKMKSALLITQYSTLPNDWWDIFTGMRRLNKPIDMILFKNDNHPPMRPDVVLAAQQLTVDWFDFWLNDERATLDRSSDHFKRWAELRQSAAIDKREYPEEAGKNQILAKMDCQKTDLLPHT